jgi:hypothetical protein
MNMFYSCKVRTRSCASCPNSSCSCKTRERSCSKCGCDTWGSWSNVSSCSSDSNTECRTLYS